MKSSLIKASFGVTLVMLLGNLMSFAKEATIANYFGISNAVDAYSIAIQVPVLLFSFISVAVQSVVIPIFSDILYNKGEEETRKYLDNLITMLLLLTGSFVLIGEFVASGIVYLLAPGFDAATNTLSTELLRVTLPGIVFSIICQVYVAVLNVHKQFVLTAFSVYFMSVGVILAVVFLHSQYGILSACVGQLIGDFTKCAFLVYLARKVHKYRISYNLRDGSVIQTVKMSLPVFWSISVAEVNAVINKIVASFLFVGSISALSYASKVNTVLALLCVSAIATIVYPLYAESSAKGDVEQLVRRVNMTISGYTLILLPLMCGIFIFKEEIITLAFARGVFDIEAVALTQSLLGYYTIGMLFVSFRGTITNVFYSLKDSRTPAVNATIGAIINIVLNLTLPYFMGVQGLALATSITAIYICVSLCYQLVKKHPQIKLTDFYSNICGIVVSACLMSATVFGITVILPLDNPIFRVVMGGAVGIITYFAFTIVFRVPIVLTIIKMVKSKK